MIALYDTLYKMSGPNTKVIPGHGPVANRDDVREYQGMLREVRKRVATVRRRHDRRAARRVAPARRSRCGGNLIKQPYLLGIVYEELTAHATH